MNSLLQEISLLVEDFGSAPKLEEMPKRFRLHRYYPKVYDVGRLVE